MLLYITRHGQVMPSREDYIGSVDFPAGDPPLTCLGREQARLLGIRLHLMKFKGRIYTSPYYRTLETAQIIAELTGCRIFPRMEIREIVKSEESMIHFKGLEPSKMKDYFHRVETENLPYPWWKGKVESYEEVQARVEPFIDELIEHGEDVLVVGHGASTSAAEIHIMNQYGRGEAITAESWNCNFSAFQIKPYFEKICIRDIAHLPPEMVSANSRMRAEKIEKGKGNQNE